MSDILGVIETSVYAEDLETAEAFYREVLGLEVVAREAGRHVFFLAGPASMVLLFNPNATSQPGDVPPHGAHGPGHFALGIAADSLEEWRQRLAEFGVGVEKEVSWPRGGRSLYLRDPAGNAVELLTPGLWGLPSGW